MTHYPPCPLTTLYPGLLRIPPDERAAWVAQAETGVELSAEQNARLGLAVSGGVLLPVEAAAMSAAQADALFGGDRRALVDIGRLAQRSATCTASA